MDQTVPSTRIRQFTTNLQLQLQGIRCHWPPRHLTLPLTNTNIHITNKNKSFLKPKGKKNLKRYPLTQVHKGLKQSLQSLNFSCRLSLFAFLSRLGLTMQHRLSWNLLCMQTRQASNSRDSLASAGIKGLRYFTWLPSLFFIHGKLVTSPYQNLEKS